MKRKKIIPPLVERIEFQAFNKPDCYALKSMRDHFSEPSCFNGIVHFRQCRVVAELMEEPTDILYARLLKLWHQSDNFHDDKPLREAAASIGRELPSGEFGKDAK